MKVYVVYVSSCIDREENSDILGVYKSQEKAKNKVEEIADIKTDEIIEKADQYEEVMESDFSEELSRIDIICKLDWGTYAEIGYKEIEVEE